MPDEVLGIIVAIGVVVVVLGISYFVKRICKKIIYKHDKRDKE